MKLRNQRTRYPSSLSPQQRLLEALKTTRNMANDHVMGNIQRGLVDPINRMHLLAQNSIQNGGTTRTQADQYMDEALGLVGAGTIKKIGGLLSPRQLSAVPPSKKRMSNAHEVGQANNEGLLSLPSPAVKKLENEIIREDQWRLLKAASERVGKRNKSGRYVGAGPDIKSPQKRAAVVRKYAERINNSLDAGIPPGYFYKQGKDALEGASNSPETLKRVADIMGPTSTQVGPYANVNYMIKAMDQKAAGVPSHVTLYPNSLRRKVDASAWGEHPVKGYKVDRYSNLLGAGGDHTNQLGMMPPNDQWEGLGTGMGRQAVPSGPAQVAFSDRIREDALQKVNAQRIANGETPLTLPEAQELHWAAIRAETEGRPLQLNPGDTVQTSLPSFEAQHSWEAAPGEHAGMRINMPEEDYMSEIKKVLIDENNKDNLIDSMGGLLQKEGFAGSGIYKGKSAPGWQSRSYVSHTQGRGIDPASSARADSTEAMRQYMLGQDARAWHLFKPTKVAAHRNAYDVKLGHPLNDDRVLGLQSNIDELTGGSGTIVPSESGYRVINVGDMPNKEFTKAMKASGVDGEMGLALNRYSAVEGASSGEATRGLLNALDSYGMPGPMAHANSAATKQIAADISTLYKKLESGGKLVGSQSLSRALEVFSREGTDGLRALVAKGLAPAIVLSVLPALQDPEQGLQYN